LTGVTVIDVTGRPVRRNATVLIRGERIVAVGHRAGIPAGAEVVDLPGKFVIPGLCDAHVHSLPVEEISPPLYLVDGITTVRENVRHAVAGRMA
jgi:imidazolonepropionase-like amidohydrolase